MNAGIQARRGRALVVASRLLLLAAIATGCASSSPRWLPPVTEAPTQRVAPGKFVWLDLVTHDAAGAQAFYGALFPWTFDGHDEYVRILHEGTPVGGIVPLVARGADDREPISAWVGNLSVADVDAAAEVVRRGGGSVEREPVDAPDRGRIALVRDPEGALLLLLRASQGDPPDGEPPPGRWLWRELWAHDPEAAVRFYAELVRYESESVELGGKPYRVMTTDEVPRAGIVEAPRDVDPQWLPYVRVEDAAATAARAEALGARIVWRDEDAVILVDPTGAPIGLQVWDGPPPESTP